MIKALVRVATGAVEGLDDPSLVLGIDAEIESGDLIWMDPPEGAVLDDLELVDGALIKNQAKHQKKEDKKARREILRAAKNASTVAELRVVIKALVEELGLDK